MRVLVVNGSPKGENSVTLQTMLFLEKKHPKLEFVYLHAGQRIRRLEKDFSEAAELLSGADLIVFCYPVYTFIAPSQLHRFIELVKESGVDLRGKFVTQVSTSKHFYDVTAHRYIEENCQDLGMKVIRGLSADMEDLLHKEGRLQARKFFHHALWAMQNDSYEALPAKAAESAVCVTDAAWPEELPENVEGTAGDPADGGDEKPDGLNERNEKPDGAFAGGGMAAGQDEEPVVIVTDAAETDRVLLQMIGRFREKLGRPSRVVNLREFPFKGGCIGCFHCAVSGQCVYTDRFDDFLRNEIQKSSAIVYAFTIRDHSMGSLFKMYDDRQFCNGHRTVTMGRPMAYLISGDYSREENLQMILEARAQVGGNHLAGIATDEADWETAVGRVAAELNYALTYQYQPPQNFFGVGGMKIFRDLIFQMQGLMRADHKFYKEHGQYDFPQKKMGTVLGMYLVGGMMHNPKVQAKLGNKMTEGMLMPYRKMLEKE